MNLDILLEDILELVRQERIRQDSLHGPFPNNATPEKHLSILVEEVGEFATDVNDGRFEDGSYPENMRKELIQIAACAVKTIQDLDWQYFTKDQW